MEKRFHKKRLSCLFTQTQRAQFYNPEVDPVAAFKSRSHPNEQIIFLSGQSMKHVQGV